MTAAKSRFSTLAQAVKDGTAAPTPDVSSDPSARPVGAGVHKPAAALGAVGETLRELSKGALNDLEGVFAKLPDDAADPLIEAIVAAKRIVVFGCGREGLQMRVFAMRLFHMGLDVSVLADMTTRSRSMCRRSRPVPA